MQQLFNILFISFSQKIWLKFNVYYRLPNHRKHQFREFLPIRMFRIVYTPISPIF